MKKKMSLNVLAFILFICMCSSFVHARELRFTTTYPKLSPYMDVLREWSDKVEQASNGGVTINIYPSSTLLGDTDAWSGIKQRAADIGLVPLGSFAKQIPLTSILSMPFFPIGDVQDCLDTWMALNDKYPQVKDEFKDFVVAGYAPKGGTALHMTKHQVRVPEDIKGLKVIAMGPIGDVVALAGGRPVFVSPPDWYTSIDRGMVDGFLMGWDGIYDMGLHELLPQHTLYPDEIIFSLNILLINKGAFREMPDNAKQAVKDLIPWFNKKYLSVQLNYINRAIEGVKQKQPDGNFVYITQEESDLWFAAGRKTHEPRIADLEAKGLPATDVYEYILELSSKRKK